MISKGHDQKIIVTEKRQDTFVKKYNSLEQSSYSIVQGIKNAATALERSSIGLITAQKR